MTATSRPTWVPDTRFGSWFQHTRVWTRYVLEPAIEQWLRLLEGVSCPLRFERVLDAGCGAGVAFGPIAERFSPRRITAVEVDPALVAAARKAAAGCARPVEVMHGDVGKLSLPDASFDLVFCHQTIHHLIDPGAGLRELYRVLQRGGRMLLAESCRAFTQSWSVRVLFRHPEGSHRTADGFRALVAEAGFVVEAEALSSPFWSKPDFGLVERLTGRNRGPREPTQLTLVARKP